MLETGNRAEYPRESQKSKLFALIGPVAFSIQLVLSGCAGTKETDNNHERAIDNGAKFSALFSKPSYNRQEIEKLSLRYQNTARKFLQGKLHEDHMTDYSIKIFAQFIARYKLAHPEASMEDILDSILEQIGNNDRPDWELVKNSFHTSLY